jgi:hypothetical protein
MYNANFNMLHRHDEQRHNQSSILETQQKQTTTSIQKYILHYNGDSTHGISSNFNCKLIEEIIYFITFLKKTCFKKHFLYQNIACQFQNCYLTNNLSYLGENQEDQFDAVIFVVHEFRYDKVSVSI